MCRQRHLRLPVRTHDEQALQFRPAEEIREHLHGGSVGPVEIVDCDDERTHGRDVGDETWRAPASLVPVTPPGRAPTRMRIPDRQSTRAGQSAHTKSAPSI